MLHLTDYAIWHGWPMDYDGLRGDNSCEFMIKDNTQSTSKAKCTLNFDVRRRIGEENVANQVSSTYFQKEWKGTSNHCSYEDMKVQLEFQDDVNDASFDSKPMFYIWSFAETVDDNHNVSMDHFHI